MHDFNGVVGIIIILELNEPIRRMLIGYFVTRKMYVQNRATLKKKLPYNLFGASSVKATYIDCGIRVSVFRGTLVSQ